MFRNYAKLKDQNDSRQKTIVELELKLREYRSVEMIYKGNIFLLSPNKVFKIQIQKKDLKNNLFIKLQARFKLKIKPFLSFS